MVAVVSYKIFAMVTARKKEVCKETIVDLRDVDIGKAADAVVETEYSVYMCAKSYQQMKDGGQKLGISSSCVRSITIII